LIGELARIVRRNAPKLILTHGPLGGYGHPAHRLVHNSVMAAVREASFSGSVFHSARRLDAIFSLGIATNRPT